MSAAVSLLFISLFSLLLPSFSQPAQPRGILIDCGAAVSSTIDGRRWVTDASYVSSGIPKNIAIPGLVPVLSTVRSFPFRDNLRRKFCYVLPVYRGAKYLVRTTYYYGGVNGRDLPPVFDQMVDGTFWSVVNTTEDYANELSSYYEGVFLANKTTMSVCVGVNSYTDSDPFLSALELVILDDSLYNTTDFKNHGLRLIARHSFGYGGPIIRYPDDQFDRFWEPSKANNPTTIASNRNISISGFWNLPPSKIFEQEITTSQSESMELWWPAVSLPNSTYYIALYLANNQNSSPGSSRVLDININGVTYYRNLNVTPAGVAIFATRWPLVGATKIVLTPAAGSDLGPLINGGEIFNILTLGGNTITRDVTTLEKIRDSFHNPPIDWSGDPCLPRGYAWTGVTCSEGPRIRVVTLNLTSMGISGTLSQSIANLTALTGIWLGNNSISGFIPDLSSLKRLETLHLEDNQLSGEIPLSLGDMGSLQEVFLQNNNLTGQIPSSLIGKPGLNFRSSPGNSFLFPPPS